MSSVAIFLGGVIAAASTGWIVNHYMPRVWPRLTRAAAVLVHIETDPSNMYSGAPNWIGSSWVLPTEVDTEALGEPPTPICRDWRKWLWPKGAYDGNYTELRVTVQGDHDSTVLVDGLKVTVIERSEPTGRCFMCPVGGADITPRSVVVDLDWDPGVVHYSDDAGESTKPFTFALARGEVETFHIHANASQRCTWTGELLLIVNGERQTVYLDDDGHPFRTSGTAGLRTCIWTADGWRERPTAEE